MSKRFGRYVSAFVDFEDLVIAADLIMASEEFEDSLFCERHAVVLENAAKRIREKLDRERLASGRKKEGSRG